MVPGFRGAVVLAAVALGVTMRASSTGNATAPPTWAAHVAPIIYKNCAPCHRPGQIAPFSLLSYEDVKTRAEVIVAVTSRGDMPPWPPLQPKGYPELRDDRRLKPDEIATLKEWAAAGMPVGDPAKAPPPPTYPVGWKLGVPDMILSMPTPIAVPADGHDIYRNVVFNLDLPIDRSVVAIDYEPSARAVVHHALFFVEPSDVPVNEGDLLPGLGRAVLLGRGQEPGSRLTAADDAWGGLGGWVPGMTPRFFPEGVAQRLPSHSNIVLQLHLHPSGKEATEDGKVALYFAKTPATKSLTGVQVPPAFGYAMGLDIPAGERRFVMKDSFTLPVDVEAHGARGHAHYLGRAMNMTATLPNGSARGILLIGDWDFAWQDSYYFKTPIRLPKGTRIDVEIIYDNTQDNPRNPNSPPIRVRWGRGSHDEMGSMTLLVVAPSTDAARELRAAQAQHFREQLARRLKR